LLRSNEARSHGALSAFRFSLSAFLVRIPPSAFRIGWGLQPVLPRQDFFTKEIRRLLHGGK
jgi:hypothetical protein